MVILIAGASHTGKTLLAQRLLEKYHYPYLSIDHLKMGLIRSGNTRLAPADDDQALMWYGTVHFAHGHFPEPCFFGQNYGSMLESLLAVPLYYLKCPLNYALPLITLLLSLVPFAFCFLMSSYDKSM